MDHSAQDIPHFADVAGFEPYPWQQRCYEGLLQGAHPDVLDIPTGLGKTSAVLRHPPVAAWRPRWTSHVPAQAHCKA